MILFWFLLFIYLAYFITAMIFLPGLWLLVLFTFPLWWPVFWYDVPIYVVKRSETVEPVVKTDVKTDVETKYQRITKNPVLNF